MIISHKYKFIFFAVPKTATHAIRFALRPHLGQDDEEHVFSFKPSKLNIDAFQDRKNGHFTVDEIKPYLSEEIWNTYYKFSFVRNPFDRFISLCFFHFKALKHTSEHVDQLVLKFASSSSESKPELFKPQTRFLYDGGRQTPLDYIGRFENIQNDFNKVCHTLNIPSTKLEMINSSIHEPYLTYYKNEDLLDLVEEMYKEDILHFGYSLDSYTGALPIQNHSA